MTNNKGISSVLANFEKTISENNEAGVTSSMYLTNLAHSSTSSNNKRMSFASPAMPRKPTINSSIRRRSSISAGHNTQHLSSPPPLPASPCKIPASPSKNIMGSGSFTTAATAATSTSSYTEDPTTTSHWNNSADAAFSDVASVEDLMTHCDEPYSDDESVLSDGSFEFEEVDWDNNNGKFDEDDEDDDDDDEDDCDDDETTEALDMERHPRHRKDINKNRRTFARTGVNRTNSDTSSHTPVRTPSRRRRVLEKSPEQHDDASHTECSGSVSNSSVNTSRSSRKSLGRYRRAVGGGRRAPDRTASADSVKPSNHAAPRRPPRRTTSAAASRTSLH